MPSMKASEKGRSLIKQAIAQKGWRIRDDRWLVAASCWLEPAGNWRADGPYAYGCSMQTWERFLQGVAVRDRSFLAFCRVLSLFPTEVAEFFDSDKSYLLNELKVPLKENSETALLQELLSRMALLEHRMSHVEDQLSSRLKDSF